MLEVLDAYAAIHTALAQGACVGIPLRDNHKGNSVGNIVAVVLSPSDNT